MPVLRIRTASGWEDVSVPTSIADASVHVNKLSATGTKSATTFLRGDNTWATVATGAPSNMVTTDTTQTILVAGAKTFGPGALLMQNGAIIAEPYSDANPPQTLNISDHSAVPPNPPAGQATMYSTDGKTLRLRDADGTDVLVGPSAGGGGASDPLPLLTEFNSTTPASPTSGVTVFARRRARALLTTVGPQGQDTGYQPALFSNRVARMGFVNGAILPTLDHLAVAGMLGTTANTTGTASAAQAVASTSFFTSLVRARYSTTATAATYGHVRSSTAQWMLSTTPNKGGFFFVCRFGVGVSQPGTRALIGMSGGTPATLSATTDPTALTNVIGLGWNAADTSMRFIVNGATANTANHFALDANFPVKTSATDFYEVRLFAPSGGGQQIHWSVTRLNTGHVQTGSYTGTGMPALEALLFATMHFTNGSTAAIASIDLQAMYIDSDN